MGDLVDVRQLQTQVKGLQLKQAVFCRELFRDFNQTQAAIRAGYSEKSAGSIASQLLTKPNIKAAVALIHAQRKTADNVNEDDITNLLLEQIYRTDSGASQSATINAIGLLMRAKGMLTQIDGEQDNTKHYNFIMKLAKANNANKGTNKGTKSKELVAQ